MERASALQHTVGQWLAARGSATHKRCGPAGRAWCLPAWMLFCAILLGGCSDAGNASPPPAPAPAPSLDQQLTTALAQQGFTGTVEQKLESRLGRPLDFKLAGLGLLLFFDPVTSLHNDNACAACHSPSHGYGDTQSIAIGIQSNGVVGPKRLGPRNLRRSPIILNAGFYPRLMWNGRFSAPSGDPFDNALGFSFPQPEGTALFRPGDPAIRTLLAAQAFMPLTELVEEAGFTGLRDSLDPRYAAFDDGQGDTCPALDASGSRNAPIRARIAERLNGIPGYVEKFGDVFEEVRAGTPIDIGMFARAVAEYEFILKGANAPIDRYARGDTAAMTDSEKHGALLFFGKANCVACHAVKGGANEMFSDFGMHNIGVPQIAPKFGAGSGNVVFDGPAEDEDYGLAQITGLASDRYRFRTSPLRNVALQPAFFHNGTFTRLDDAVRHHLDVLASLRGYDARRAGVAPDLAHVAPIAKVAGSIDPLLRRSLRLSPQEFDDLVQFVRSGLLDDSTLPEKACTHVPAAVPSGMALAKFEACPVVPAIAAH
jgi:cytochrome c peroxidase